MTELDAKLIRIRELLRARSLDALLLQRVENFAWATCGAASYVDIAVATGASSLLITSSGQYVITDNIEGPRLMQEEGLEAQGWEFREAAWFEQKHIIADLTSGLKLGADTVYPGAVDLSSALSQVRSQLTAEEVERFRSLSKLSAAAMEAAIRAVRPGMSEYEIAGLLAAEAWSRGIVPTVDLVGTDERIFRFRHPLPTEKRLERYAMLILCGRKSGLVCSLTRLIHFGRLPDELRAKAAAVAQVDAHFIAATRPKRRLAEVFQEAMRAYKSAGFPDEWRLHHQGGLAGYVPREIIATPDSEGEVSVGQVYAWNPSITGTKSEDTILVGENTNEILTAIAGWPAIPVQVDGHTIERPGVLEIG